MHVLLFIMKLSTVLLLTVAWASSLPNVKTLWVPRPIARLFLAVTKPIYGGRSVDAVTVGHCILVLGICTPYLLAHEGQHVDEAKQREPRWYPRFLGRAAIGTLSYWAAYLVEYVRHGYYNNRFEVEARTAAGQEKREGTP